MSNRATLRGMATVSYWAKDVKAAKHWYAEFLGIEPYFERPVGGPPAYVEFRVGDQQDELGLVDSRYAPKGAVSGMAPGGAVLYWHVDDVKATFDRLRALGATEFEPITQREEGFVTAAVVDPFGNVLGIMYNPHYLKVLDGSQD
jgi:predicted enzyme related to lactoylglutathione lyase